MEQELDILLASPQKKRTMRMYADDVEDEIASKRWSVDEAIYLADMLCNISCDKCLLISLPELF